MPFKPLHPCRFPRCPELTSDRYCPKHTKQAEAQVRERRGKTNERGYDSVWERVRLMVLRREPLCRRCKARGIVTAATVVDHIIPLPDGARLALENLQPLCDACHNEKTAEDAAKKWVQRTQ